MVSTIDYLLLWRIKLYIFGIEMSQKIHFFEDLKQWVLKKTVIAIRIYFKTPL